MMDTLPIWVAVPVALLLVASGFLTLTGSLGLLRLPTFYSRIHAPTLGNTLGVFGVLLSSILVSSTLEERYVVHQLLITVLLVITSPVTAMLLMRAAIKRQKPPTPPPDASSDSSDSIAAPLSEPHRPASTAD